MHLVTRRDGGLEIWPDVTSARSPWARISGAVADRPDKLREVAQLLVDHATMLQRTTPRNLSGVQS